MKPFSKSKVNTGRPIIPQKQQPIHNIKTNNLYTKYNQQQQEEIVDESQSYGELGQSLAGERQFIPFCQQNSQSSIQQNISIGGTMEKVYFQNASQVNKQELMRDTKIHNQICAFQKSSKTKRESELTSIKTNANIKDRNVKDMDKDQNKAKSAAPIGGNSRKCIEEQNEDQNQNEFLQLHNVGKWNKSSNSDTRNRQAVVSEQMRKMHTHYQNRLSETKWVKRKRELESRQSEERTIVSENIQSLSKASFTKQQLGQDEKGKNSACEKRDEKMQEQSNKRKSEQSKWIEKEQDKREQSVKQQQEEVQVQEQEQEQAKEQEQVEEQEKDEAQQEQSEQEQEEDEQEDEQQQDQQEEQQQDQQQDQQEEQQVNQDGQQQQQEREQEQQKIAQQSPTSHNPSNTQPSSNTTIQSINTNVKKWSQSKSKQQLVNQNQKNSNNSQLQNKNNNECEQTNKEQIQDLTQGEVQNYSIDPNWEPLEQILLRILKLVN